MGALPSGRGASRVRARARAIRALRNGSAEPTTSSGWFRSAYVFGPHPVGEAIERVEALDAAAGDSILLEAGATASTRAPLCDERVTSTAAATLYTEARETYGAAGMTVSAAQRRPCTRPGSSSVRATSRPGKCGALGRYPSWSRLERACVPLDCCGIRLAQCLYLQDRLDEVAELCVRRTRDQAPREDLVNFVYADALEAAVLARRARPRRRRADVAAPSSSSRRPTSSSIRARDRLLRAEMRTLLQGALTEAESTAGAALHASRREGRRHCWRSGRASAWSARRRLRLIAVGGRC